MTKICKYCLQTDEIESNFISPCKCKGSMEWVHKNCLIKFLKFNPLRKICCPECNCKIDLQLNTNFYVSVILMTEFIIRYVFRIVSLIGSELSQLFFFVIQLTSLFVLALIMSIVMTVVNFYTLSKNKFCVLKREIYLNYG